MNYLDPPNLESLQDDFCNLTGYKFDNSELIQGALSYPGGNKNFNHCVFQRLEFLGDKVLSFIISEFLFNQFKEESEFQLTVMHSNMTMGKTLALIAIKIGIDDLILMKKSDIASGENKRTTVLENVMEAIIGAVYLDKGIDEARAFILKFWQEHIQECNISDRGPKSILQELVQKQLKTLPKYKLISEEIKENKSYFTVSVSIKLLNLECLGCGFSKRNAEKDAAKQMIELIKGKKSDDA